MSGKRDEIIKALPGVYALPVSAIEVIRLCGRADVGVAEIARTLERDPLLTAEVLRLANSAFFGAPGTADTVRAAAVRLGTDGLQRVAIAAGLSPLAGKAVAAYDLPPGALLDHMRATAIGTSIIATRRGQPPPSHAFTAAILLDIGKLVLAELAHDDLPEILAACREPGVPFDAAERRVLGIDHAEAGALLLAQWGLPESIIRVVRWHHQPEALGEVDVALDLAHASDALSLSMGFGLGCDGLHYALDQGVFDRLGLDTRAAEAVAAEMLAVRPR